MSGGGPLLETRALTKRFGGVTAVDGLSMSLTPGEIRGLIGPNGSGKTTTINLLSGLYRADDGEVRLRGERIDRLRPHQVTAHGVARTFDYPVAAELAGWARDAGWADAVVDQDPTVAIRLPDADAFVTWRGTGSRGAATAGWSEEQHAALTADMLAVTPRQPDGSYAIPFGALYLTART